MILSCGDLPHHYLDYAASTLDVPLYYVHGNHDSRVRNAMVGNQITSFGGVNIHRKIVFDRGLLIGGVEGSLRYNFGSYQYTQAQMWVHIFSLIPGLIKNRLIFGRYLDIFISHAPPWGIHDQPDPAHRGIKAFTWLLRTFKPKYHFHGHVHVFRPDTVTASEYYKTRVINAYRFAEAKIDPLPSRNALLSFLRRS
ncbi:MAG: metallophosphoesterase [Anaerolineales bacterium]|nr:metallophosphoesterase [Anaerolineales bacterium]